MPTIVSVMLGTLAVTVSWKLMSVCQDHVKMAEPSQLINYGIEKGTHYIMDLLPL